MRRIYIVEDDDIIRDAVLYALRASGFEALGYGNAAGFYDEVLNGPGEAAFVILDVMLPGDDGLTILKKIRNSAKTKNLPVIMLTARGSEFDRVTGLDLGADDYIVKPFSVMELVSRINAVLRRTNGAKDNAEPKTLEYGGIRLDHTKRIVTADGKNIPLTFKEYELLYYLLINGGLALSREMILGEVWGYDFEGESRTLDMHIRSLRRKLGASGAHINTIRNFGYRLGS
jgi:two-component system alkaline phosphatase synthesis response regulator PhoP